MRKFETNNYKIIKNSNYGKVLKLFLKISNFFPNLRYGMFAFHNSEQRQKVSKKTKSLFAVTNGAVFILYLFAVNNSRQLQTIILGKKTAYFEK